MTAAAPPAPVDEHLLPPPRRRPAPVGTAWAVAAAVTTTAAALLLGAATEVGQGVLPDGLGPFVNSVAAWVVLPAALVAVLLAVCRWRGRRGTVLAVAGGVLTTEALVAGYYGWAALVSGTPHAASSIALWAASGLVSGCLAGVCAFAWTTVRGTLRGAATGLLAAVPLADGVRTLLLAPDQAAGAWTFVALAVAAPLVLLRRGERLAGALALVCTAALGAGGFALLDAVATLAGRA